MAIHRIRLFGASVSILICTGWGCAGDPVAAPSNRDAPVASPEASPETSPEASPKTKSNLRLDRATLDSLGAPPASSCAALAIPADLVVGDCKVVGPYPGAIAGSDKSAEFEGYQAALEACVAAPECIGVSSDWYAGFPWYWVSGKTFAADSDSYACTLVLDCT